MSRVVEFFIWDCLQHAVMYVKALRKKIEIKKRASVWIVADVAWNSLFTWCVYVYQYRYTVKSCKNWETIGVYSLRHETVKPSIHPHIASYHSLSSSIYEQLRQWLSLMTFQLVCIQNFIDVHLKDSRKFYTYQTVHSTIYHPCLFRI